MVYPNQTVNLIKSMITAYLGEYIFSYKNEILQVRRERSKKKLLPGAQWNTLEAKGCNEK